ncbi:hypothetical protein [Candidatus Methylacidithermus pantelleriae]|uniref:hypothetical protein n=1 Tax=Candidatus Methylacidithermus pantelleriae TaxID=2744239 RepID=UPI001BD62CE0|nr:hypothetical protein [Candidatus Methylacidithermus pantelleriae]
MGELWGVEQKGLRGREAIPGDGWVKTALGAGWKRSSIARIFLRGTSLVLYDLSRVYFQEAGESDWPVTDTAGITDGTGAKCLF